MRTGPRHSFVKTASVVETLGTTQHVIGLHGHIDHVFRDACFSHSLATYGGNHAHSRLPYANGRVRNHRQGDPTRRAGRCTGSAMVVATIPKTTVECWLGRNWVCNPSNRWESNLVMNLCRLSRRRLGFVFAEKQFFKTP